jgi:hypothetical protein
MYFICAHKNIRKIIVFIKLKFIVGLAKRFKHSWWCIVFIVMIGPCQNSNLFKTHLENTSFENLSLFGPGQTASLLASFRKAQPLPVSPTSRPRVSDFSYLASCSDWTWASRNPDLCGICYVETKPSAGREFFRMWSPI